MHLLPSAQSPRRLSVAGAAMLLLASLGAGATAGPAHAAIRVTFDWSCSDGFYYNSTGHLHASECSGSGATNVYVSVGVLSENTGPQDVQATLYCISFTFNSGTGNGNGSCSIYSYG
jgi:hypothetical protein